MIELKNYSITVRLTKEQAEMLKEISEQKRVSKAEVIRKSIERSYKNNDTI